MTTSSSNIAGVLKPIGMIRRGFWPCCSGCICKIEEIPVNKKKKKNVYPFLSGKVPLNVGVYEVVDFDGEINLLEMKEKRYIVNGKKGIWRTIRGRHYFFPDDKSGVIPNIKGSE